MKASFGHFDHFWVIFDKIMIFILSVLVLMFLLFLGLDSSILVGESECGIDKSRKPTSGTLVQFDNGHFMMDISWPFNGHFMAIFGHFGAK